MMTVTETMSPDDLAWEAAFRITWRGEPNPARIREAIALHAARVGGDHPAVQAMTGQLDFMTGRSSRGPANSDEVIAHAVRLGLRAA